MPRTSYSGAIVVSLALAAFAAPSRSATVFNDNFNRVDPNGLGSNWTHAVGGQLGTDGSQAHLVFGGPNTMYFLSGLTGAYTHTTLKVDVSNTGAGGQSIALCIGQATSPSSDGLYLQLRTTDVTGQFKIVEFDNGVNGSDPSKWTTPTNQFTPTPFAEARITASALDVDTIRIGIDTDKNGADEEFFTRDLNLGNMGFGNRMGISINGGNVRADNFSASVINPANVTWNVTGGGTWDSTSNNWTGGGPHPNKFFNTDHAIFDNTAGGTITLASGGQGISPGSTTVNASSGTYTFAGSGIRTGTLTKQGFGRLVLTNPNIFTGITTVHNSGGTVSNGAGAHLTLNNPSGNALSGDLHIGVGSASGGSVAKVNLAQSNQIADNRVIYFDSSAGNWAYLSLRGNSETVAGVVSTNTGGVIENGNFNGAINTDGTLTLAPPASTTHSFGGIIRDADVGGGTGKFNLTVNGPGTQVLASGGTYTYTGATTVNSGTLRVDGALGATDVTVNSGATLAGNGGASGNVAIAGGTLAPGASIGSFDVAGDFSFTATSVFNAEIDLDGTPAADLLNVTGGITLNGASLELELLDATTSGFPNTILILSNDGTDAVVGTFGSITGLPPEWVATFNYAFSGSDALGRVGSGNDVAITIAASLPGDFDNDGDVDGGDFLVWQRGESPSSLSSNDLDDWQANYGAGSFTAAIAFEKGASPVAVPEPQTVVFYLAGIGATIPRRRSAAAHRRPLSMNSES